MGKKRSSFERFCIAHAVVMNMFFAAALKSRRLYELSLSGRYAKGYGGAGDIEIGYLLEIPELIKCSSHFPQERSITANRTACVYAFGDGDYYRNAPSAPFADGFYVCRFQRYQGYPMAFNAEKPACLLVTEKFEDWKSTKCQLRHATRNTRKF